LNTLLFENYKFGINASFPLFLRSARGDLELVRLEMTSNQLKINQKQLEILNKVEALGKELEVTFQQVETNQAMVLNYQRLLDAENEKFRVGESSIFLLNTREQKLIEAQLKLLKLKTNYSKLKGKLDWAAGQLQ
jgi:outer membrane protein TolC